MPVTLAGPDVPPIPTPAVSYHYFLSVANKYKTRHKDLPVDQCGKCNQLRAAVKGADANDRPLIVAEWLDHKRQAGKGPVHRKMRTEECAAPWVNVDLPDSAPVSYPPPPLPSSARRQC